MGEKFTSKTIVGYDATPPSDDGSTTEANRLKWSTIKTKLPDPIKTWVESIQTALITFFDQSVVDKSTAFTVTTAEHNRVVNVTAAADITLGDAATLAVGYIVTIKNSHTATINVLRTTGTDTIDGTAADDTILAGTAKKYIVNSGADGFLSLLKDSSTLSSLTVDNDATVGGDIIVTGVVDGRDVATDGTKLDGISAGATVNETLTILDTPENLTSALTAGSWVTVNSTTLNTATATKAIIKIHSQQQEASATRINHAHYLRKTGSALAANALTKTGSSYRDVGSAATFSLEFESESIVNLDASFDFDYQITTGTDGASGALDSVSVVLIGYYS